MIQGEPILPKLPVYKTEKQETYVRFTMLAFAVILILYGLTCNTPTEIIQGVSAIVNTQAGLITDSIVVGGMGGAFVNAGLVTLMSIGLMWATKTSFTGMNIACLFLMAGFSLFGKDICNILPIILGGYLYSIYKRESFGKYIYATLYGTALAPVVTEVISLSMTRGSTSSAVSGWLVGIAIGFVLPPISTYTMRIHQGYNLYNVGFTAGLIGMVLASIFKSMGHDFETRFEWSTGNNFSLFIFLFLLFSSMVLVGFLWNGNSFQNLWRLTRHSGRSIADFVILDGYPVTLMNMGIVGVAATVYVLLVGGQLNGPTIGGIFSVCGFGAFGKHIRNITPVVLGVVLSSFFMVWELQDPAVLLAALFATGLAPIAGQFGWIWGMIAGFVHASVVLNVGILHAGLNLYNNGFSAGLVCIVLLPLIEALKREKEQ
ncbi:MAG: DUF1576 domain-containing protein [Anaerotruncus sp.]|nr:DUF1576 domain-containing protein [Anaerotruncus sp.]